MRQIRIIACFVFLYLCTNMYAQLSTNELPVSFDSKSGLREMSKSTTPVATMPELDMPKIEMEDMQNERKGIPYRFGYKHKVHYDLNNSGIWYEFPNGDRLWQLNVVCPNALSINFCYDKFWIPEGGKLFVYSKDRKQCIGAFTSKNNKGDIDHLRGFATELIYGSEVVLEYFQPKDVSTDAIMSLDYIVHGYRNVKAGAGALPCMVNINCDEGQNWQNEKNAIARMIIEGSSYGTGSLINTTNLSEVPFFLTANHCVTDVGKDALGNSNLDNTLFYWNYEAPGCANISGEPSNSFVTHGATVIANNSISDFALLRLSEDPKDYVGYTPNYLGWDHSGQSGDSCVCIHHPGGDVKKISTSNGQPTNYIVNWEVAWKSNPNGYGITQGGSSGSPLINNMHRVIGQLEGANFEECYNPNVRSYFGCFNMSWTGNNNNSIQRRLNCWLDSLNTSAQTMEGLLVIRMTKAMNTDQELYSNIRIANNGQLIVQSNIELKGNSQVIVESGGQLIIDGGTLSNVDLDLKAGSTLRIINGGVIDTSNGFRAPLGAIVDVVYGQIM